MTTGRSARDDERGIGPIEHELSMHLERAHELGERAQLANDAVKREIDEARVIVARLGHAGGIRRP